MREELRIDVIADISKFRGEIKSVLGILDNLSSKITDLGNELVKKITTPVMAMAKATVSSFASFDKAMVESTAIINATSDQIQRMKEEALSLATKSTFGPAKLAEAYYFLASAGYNAEQQIKLLPIVTRFAQAGAFDLATATSLAANAQNALGMVFKDSTTNARALAYITDVLVKANVLADATTKQFATALTNDAGSALRGVNKGIAEGTAVLAAYAAAGKKGREAGSMLGRSIRLLSKSAIKNKTAHEALGLSVFDSTGNMRNMADIIQNLEEIMAGKTDRAKSVIWKRLGFDALQRKAIEPLMGLSSKVREFQGELEKAGGTTDTVANKQLKALSNQFEILKNTISTAMIELGTSFQPIMENVVDIVKQAVEAFKQLSPETKTTAVKIGLIAASIGPAILAVKMFVPLIAKAVLVVKSLALIFASGGVGVLIAGAIAAAAYYTGNWVTQFSSLESAWKGFERVVNDWWFSWKDVIMSAFYLAKEVFNHMFIAYNWVMTMIKTVTTATLAWVGSLFFSTSDDAKDALEEMKIGVTNFFLYLAAHLAHIKDVWEIVWMQSKLSSTTFFADLLFFFVSKVPNAVKYMGDVIAKTMFTTFYNLARLVNNTAAGLAQTMLNLPNILRGKAKVGDFFNLGRGMRDPKADLQFTPVERQKSVEEQRLQDLVANRVMALRDNTKNWIDQKRKDIAALTGIKLPGLPDWLTGKGKKKEDQKKDDGPPPDPNKDEKKDDDAMEEQKKPKATSSSTRDAATRFSVEGISRLQSYFNAIQDANEAPIVTVRNNTGKMLENEKEMIRQLMNANAILKATKEALKNNNPVFFAPAALIN